MPVQQVENEAGRDTMDKIKQVKYHSAYPEKLYFFTIVRPGFVNGLHRVWSGGVNHLVFGSPYHKSCTRHKPRANKMRKENRWIRSMAMFALMAATMLFTACNPDEKPDNPDNGNSGQNTNMGKKIKEVTASINGTPQTYSYTWEGNLLTKIEMEGAYSTGTITLSYVGGKLNQLLYEDQWMTESFLYTWNDNQIDKELHTFSFVNNPEEEQFSCTYTYTYTNGKITQMKELDNDDPEPYFCTFLWSGDNLVKYKYDDDYENVSYEYDDKKNPFHMTQIGFEPAINSIFPAAVAWSANNVTKRTYIEEEYEDILIYNYTYDDDGYPTTMSYTTDDGTVSFTFTYYK